tara:strand:- start:206 stop:454 length:249 start_codon:yes stop_codon:yes gene_type:complete
MTRLVILIIKIYQYFVSPLIGNNCRFLPTCSEYFITSLRSFGLFKGSILGLKRLFKCHPFKILGGTSGLDFVPIKNKDTVKK